MGGSAADAADFEEFVRARYEALRRFGVLLTGDVWAAEDLVQTVLAQVYRKWHRAERIYGLEPYTRKLMVNEVRKASKRMWNRESPHAAPDDPRLRPDHAPAVDESVVMLQALRSLPAGQRLVLVLRYWEDMTEPEIARELAISVGTVKSRLSRAIAHMRAGNEIKDLRGSTS